MREFMAELRRRRVVRVAAVYVVIAWAIVQAADVFFPALRLPEWTITLVAALTILGFPVAVVLAWAFEITPDGVKRAEPLDAAARRPTGRIAAAAGAVLLALAGGAWWATEGTTPEPDLKSIAVLPFDNMSVDPENEFLTAGIHEEILTQLALIGDLKVISRTSVEPYRESEKSLREIGAELGVATVVEGSVQRFGNKIRVTAQLIDARTDEHLWANRYDRDLTDVFMIQTAVAKEIASALNATLSPGEEARIARTPTEHPEAYTFYLRGNEYREAGGIDPGSENYRLAAEMYQKAVELDPGFALAYAWLSYAHSELYWFSHDRTEGRLAQAELAARKALSIDPDLPEAHYALGTFHYHGHLDYAAAEQEFAIARAGLPNNARLFAATAFVQRRQGRWDEALPNLERAVELDPRSVRLADELAGTYLRMRRLDAAERALLRVIALAPNHATAHSYYAAIPVFRNGDLAATQRRLDEALVRAVNRNEVLGWWSNSNSHFLSDAQKRALLAIPLDPARIDPFNHYIARAEIYRSWNQDARAREHYDSARVILEPMVERFGEREPSLYASLGYVHAALGNREDAVRFGERALDLVPFDRDALRGPDISYGTASTYALAGEREKALDLLERLVAHGYNYYTPGLIRADPVFAPLRDHPRFRALTAGL